ncbi:MAG: dephospho-CoA kinase [Ruminococcaceae bacterium]|nr:dephospho-CoA kinase [Oscillospiraceae bacterium]
MTIIGITGPSGAGKSMLSDYLKERGLPVLDADAVYHELLLPPSPCLDALRSAFGSDIFFDDGTLNRRALSDIVFHDKAKLTRLNETVLGLVLAELRQRIAALAKAGETAVAVDAPTLIESGFHRECSAVVSVLAPAELRLARIMERDGLSPEAAQARLQAQQKDGFYRAHSQYILINEGRQEEFFAKCDELLSRWRISPLPPVDLM